MPSLKWYCLSRVSLNEFKFISLKPENILIDKDGYAKLTDFGLSKENINTGGGLATSFCGTCEYLAPEVITASKDRTYGQSIDWWSFGCVLYEMLSGIPPFYSKKREDLFILIRTRNPNFFTYHSKEAVDLISRLLEKNPAKRLINP
jgi:serum/glucocorticoid-regulated kinase 2